MEIDLRSIVLYLSEKEMSATAIHNDIIKTLGPNTISYKTVTKYLRATKFSPCNSPIQKKRKNS